MEAEAVKSLSLGACMHGMTRFLLHLSQLEDGEFAKTVDGMLRARLLSLKTTANPDMSVDGYEFSPWPLTCPEPRGSAPLTAGEEKRRAIAARVFSLVPGEQGVPLDQVNHDFALRLCMVQTAIDELRASTPAYTGQWGPPESFAAPIDLGPAWATFYLSALAYAVGGPAAQERLDEIGIRLNAEKCHAGVADTYYRLVAMDPADRPRAFESIDCSDYYFDPPVVAKTEVEMTR